MPFCTKADQKKSNKKIIDYGICAKQNFNKRR
jgi:hypothetical protein